jgi:type II secretory pathway pseudopilin PulG
MTRNEPGFSLAELLAAMGVLAIGLVGILAVVPVASHALQEGHQLSTAAFLAQQRLEEIRGSVWTAAPGPASDCLGRGPMAAPVSLACARSAPAACVRGTACTTFPDEASVPGHPAYGRTVRIIDCGAAACGGVTDENLRLAIVSVSYAAMSGAGVAPTPRTVSLGMLIARRL